MTQILFKKIDYTLEGLLYGVESGEIGLPDIQRPFVWSAARVRDLFDSMFKGFPVGFLLFWANDELEGTKPIGVEAKQRVPRLLIVDGQQRMTSLYAVLRGIPVVNADYQEKHINISFRPRDGRFEVADAAIRKDPEFVPDLSELWSWSASFGAIEAFLGKLSASREVSNEERNAIARNIDGVFDLRRYPFTALEIASAVDEEQVADIFVRINSEGVKLNQADFILTLLSVFWDSGRAALEEFCRASRVPAGGASPFNHHLQPEPDQLLRTAVAVGFGRGRLKSVYQVLRGKDSDTGLYSPELRDAQFERLREAQEWTLDLTSWHEYLKCLTAAGFRSNQMISSENAILYTYALFLLGRKRYGLEPHRLRRLIARWFFMATLTGRYTNSPETVMDQDLARLREIQDADAFEQTLEQLMITGLTSDFWEITLPFDLATSSARAPGLFAYYAALNVLGAPVLFSKIRIADLFDPAVHAKRAVLERHHLFPVGYLRSLGVTEIRETNQIANFALLEWGDNGEITDRAPSDYFPEYAARVPEGDRTEMLRLHALPEGWVDMPYRTFLETRRAKIAEIIRQGFERVSEGGRAEFVSDIGVAFEQAAEGASAGFNLDEDVAQVIEMRIDEGASCLEIARELDDQGRIPPGEQDAAYLLIKAFADTLEREPEAA